MVYVGQNAYYERFNKNCISLIDQTRHITVFGSQMYVIPNKVKKIKYQCNTNLTRRL